MKVHLRGSTYHLRKRVPRRYAHLETRKEVWVSLATDSKKDAEVRAPAVWSEMVNGWEAKLRGNSEDAHERFQAARQFARSKGFRYMPVSEVATLPMEELLRRIEAITLNKQGKPDLLEADALLGTARRPCLTVSGALNEYWKLTEDEVIKKNNNQLRIWRNGRKKAISNFIRVVGDLPLNEITADDLLDFREWWWRRIKEEGLSANSANKDIAALSKIFRIVNTKRRLGLTLSLSGMALAEKDKGTRPPFSPQWIQDKLLAPSALDGLNLEARCVLLGMINTGYRPSEACGIKPEHIHLDGDFPYIEIIADGRDLKTKHSERVLPLTGVSLDAFKACPNGFTRYLKGSGPSALINKFLRVNGLAESSDHTLYSLRHSFEDRLLDASVDERIRRDLMGHALNRERYGKGANIEHLHRIVGAIAF